MSAFTRRALLVTAMAGSAALALTACGGTSTSEEGGSTEITFFAFQGQSVMDPVIAAFEEAHPDISVVISYNSGSGGDYANTLQTRIAGNQTPDVFQIVSENRSEILANGLAADLTGQPAVDSVEASWLDLYRDDDGVHAVSFTAWMGGIMYNRALLAEAGYAEFPETWGEFVAMGEDLLDAGITPYYEEQQIASGSLTALLASSFAADGIPSDEWVLDGRPEGSTFADSWTPVIEEWETALTSGVMPTEQIGLDNEGITAAFMQGDVAMFRSGNWHKDAAEEAGIDYGFAAFPAYPGGETYINGGADPGYALAASSDGDQRDAALEFINYLGSPEGVQLLVDGQNAMSISTEYTTDPGDAFRDTYENNLLTGRKYWLEWTTASGAMTSTMSAQQQLLFQGTTTPADFAAEMDAQAAK